MGATRKTEYSQLLVLEPKIALLYALILCLKMCLSCAGELDIWCIAAEKASPPIMPPKGLLLPDLCPSKNAPVSWKVSWEFGYAGRFFVNFYWNCCTVPFNSVNLLLHFVCLFRQKRAEIPYNSSRKYNAKKLLHLSMQELFGAATQIRTGDLILTKRLVFAAMSIEISRETPFSRS